MLQRLSCRVVAALVMTLPLLSCGTGGEDGPGGEPSKEESSASAGTTSSPAPPAITVGTQPYASPCRLLTGQDVTEIYGKLGPYADFDEEGVDAPQPADEYGRPVDSACSYRFDDRDNTTVALQVDQYPSAAHAEKDFRSTIRLGRGSLSRQIERDLRKDSPLADVLRALLEIQRENEAKDGGVPAPAIGEDILYVPGRGWFEALRGNVIIRLERRQFESNPFDATHLKGTVRQTKTAFERIDARLADLADDQTPADPWWPSNEGNGWPRPLRPCDLLDAEVLHGVSGRTTPDVLLSTALTLRPEVRLKRNSRPGARAVTNSCERRQPTAGDGPTTYAELEVWYAPPGHTGAEVLDGALIRTISGVNAEATETVEGWREQGFLNDVSIEGADKAYVVSTTQDDGENYAWLAAQVGEHVLIVSAFDFVDSRHVGASFTALEEVAAAVVAAAREVL